jgi:hypothetical protein
MSAFDRKVLEWLNEADLPDKSKQTVLERTSAGIKAYRNLFDQDPKLADALPVDFTLDDVVGRAMRRLKDGEKPLVSLGTPTVPKIQLRPSASRASSRPASARAGAAPTTSRSEKSQPATTRVIARPATASARAALVSKPSPMPRRANGALLSSSRSPTSPAATKASNKPAVPKA